MSRLWEASPKWLREHGLAPKDARRLFAALCTLADYEGPLNDALIATRGAESDLSQVCKALRYLVDGE